MPRQRVAIRQLSEIRRRNKQEMGSARGQIARALDRFSFDSSKLRWQRASLAGLPIHQFRERTLATEGLIGRDRELALLESLWEEVLENGTRVAVIVAESGVGKSRLASELYARIAATINAPEWPSTNPFGTQGATINPVHEGSQVQAPWIWWGISCPRIELSDSEVLSPAFLTAMPYLQPYIQPLLLDREVRGATRDAVVSVARTAASLVSLGVLDLASNLHGAYEHVRQLRDLRRKSSAASEIPTTTEGSNWIADTRKNTVDPLVDLNGVVEAQGGGMVLLLGDAQFVDPQTLKFIDELLDRAVAENWKLLLICTCWLRE